MAEFKARYYVAIEPKLPDGVIFFCVRKTQLRLRRCDDHEWQ